MGFRITGLPAEQFAPLFALDDHELKARGAVRRIADGNYPCRVSLTDSRPGDELLLLNYEHHDVASPYRMRFAIYVRKGEETYDAVDEVPDQLRRRMLAVRSFDEVAMMVAWELIDGRDLGRRSSGSSATPARPICTCISPRPAATRRGSRGGKIADRGSAADQIQRLSARSGARD